MSEQDLLQESIERLLDDHDQLLGHTSVAGLDEVLWQQLVESGLDRIGLSEAAGGYGGHLREAMTVVRALGRHGASVPLPETALLAGWVLERAGGELPPGISTVVAPDPQHLTATNSSGTWWLEGRAERVPWLSVADNVVLIARHADGWVAGLVDRSDLRITSGSNLAGEPRDTVEVAVEVEDVLEIAAADVERLRLRTGLVRSVQMAGALQTVLNITIDHVNQREQFGRPLSKFQVIKQQLAQVAGEAAAASASLATAVRVIDHPDAWLPVGAARARAARSATVATPIVHQLHGALGFTEEHVLHRYTTRLWSWRDEGGSEARWERELGRRLADRGPTRLWPLMTSYDTANSATTRGATT